jgi:hypothetical protein
MTHHPSSGAVEQLALLQDPAGGAYAGGAYVPTVFVGMYATQGQYKVRVLKHYYGLNHLRYLTTRTYRRARLFDSELRLTQSAALRSTPVRLHLSCGGELDE